MSDIEHFWQEALEMFSVEKCPAVPGFEGVSPSSETENQGVKPERLEEPLVLKRITDGMIPKLQRL